MRISDWSSTCALPISPPCPQTYSPFLCAPQYVIANLSFQMVEIKRKGHSPKENCNGRDISAFSRAAANGKGKLLLPLVYHIFLISSLVRLVFSPLPSALSEADRKSTRLNSSN